MHFEGGNPASRSCSPQLYDQGDIDEAGNATAAVVHKPRRIHLYIAGGACFGLAATATVVWMLQLLGLCRRHLRACSKKRSISTWCRAFLVG